MRTFIKAFFFITLFCIIGTFIYRLTNETTIDIVENCKVIKLQQQNLLNGQNQTLNTEIRYIVITDKETFICESSLMNDKFNNSDIFFRLKEDSTYNFKVSGNGKTALTDYRNILDVLE